jgi:hypothetical protein
MIFLRQYWSQLLLLAFSSLLFILWTMERLSHSSTKAELIQYKTGLEVQNATLLEEAKKYEQKLKALPTEITKIQTKYKVIYEEIDQWKGDTNASDCENADSFLRSFQY